MTEDHTARAYQGCYHEEIVDRIVEDARRYDHAAQRVARLNYSYFRQEAFDRRKMAREAAQIEEEDVEHRPDHDWPLLGEVASGVE